jgi:hypothetical protein
VYEIVTRVTRLSVTAESRESLTTDFPLESSLYFTIVTLATVGYGDVTPANDIERSYATALALVGAIVFAYCIGSISSLAAQGNSTEAKIEETLKSLTDFFRWH